MVKAHREAVARALFKSTERSLPWEKLTAPEQSDWFRMADAAIQALKLRAEWGYTDPEWPEQDAAGWWSVTDLFSAEEAQEAARAAAVEQGGRTVARLVSEWVGEQQ